MAVTDVTKLLDDADAEYELLHHDHTERAVAEAQALGLAPEEIAKTLIVQTAAGHIRALVPASRRIDMRKVRDLIGGRKDDVQLATEEEMARDYPEFELGAVPPLGGAQPDRVIVDRALTAKAWIVFEAGSHDDSIRVRTEDLLRLTKAEVHDIGED